MIRRGFLYFSLAILWSTLGWITVKAQSSSTAPLISIIKHLESETEYRFLYRESLITDIDISLNLSNPEEQIFKELEEALLEYSIGLSIDENRFQALLFKSNKKVTKKKITISGFVLDSKTGERLPFATMAWKENGDIRGVASNNSGAFYTELETADKENTFLFSFVGYKPVTIDLNFEEKKEWSDLAIRLDPESLSSKEIVINGVNFYSPRDTVYSGLVRNGVFNPLGESNSIRTLQLLPAVQTSTAINEGLNIRGSSSDGFIVQLDGVTIYNQSHLFGLLDSFNSDVLQSSGFYYDITPAQLSAPLGGTLSLITRTGSLNEFSGNAGFSNTSYRGTIEGPIIPGKASYLFSGRFSYMNDVDWFNNSSLIEWGLDVDRPQSLVRNELDFEEFGLNLGSYDASFYDLHGKIYFEGKDGRRFQISGYTGTDDTKQFYTRCINTNSTRPCQEPRPRFNNELIDMDTRNRWGSNAVSVQYQKASGSNAFSQTSIGFTSYDLDYNKDDFLFTVNEADADNFFIQPLIIENALNQFQVNHTLDVVLPGVNLSTGIEYQYIEVDYRENSLDRLNLLESTTANQVDIFNQLDFTDDEYYTLFVGNRFHYFSNGSYARWSPRYKLSLFPKKPTTFSIGFSRNYQFLNKIQFSNANTGDVWILADETEEPASVNQFTSGLYMNLGPTTFFQVEGYLKSFDNIRLHELSTIYLNFNFQSDTPFISETKGFGQGLEFLLRQRSRKVDFTTTYTLSNMQLENVLLNRGEPFDAAWDRTHQSTTTFGYNFNPFLKLNISYTFATGTPNQIFEVEEVIARQRVSRGPNSRLPDYHRFDLSFNFEGSSNGRKLMEGNVFLFNVFDRQNVWYRDLTLAFRRQPAEIVPSPVDVYDLGFQPSFNLTFYF